MRAASAGMIIFPPFGEANFYMLPIIPERNCLPEVSTESSRKMKDWFIEDPKAA